MEGYMEIRLENLTKQFDDVTAVNNMSVTIPSGKLIGLLGPSGCGKSTTLFMLAGLHEVTAGRIYFGDDDVTDIPPEKRGIGLVFQNYALYPHMTVEQNICFPLENMKVPKEERLKVAKEMAELVQIGELLHRKPAELSGGQQQRVAIARALAKKPNILLLDEPLSNLDARLRLTTREEIKRIQQETGITTVFVTHDQEEAMSISDEMIVMKDGFFQQQDVPQKMYEKPINQFVASFLGTPSINIVKGEIKNNVLFIGEDELMTIQADNQEVNVGIRPEAFISLDDNGLTVDVEYVEHIGRDNILVGTINGSNARVILTSKFAVKDHSQTKLSVDLEKVHVFNSEGELIK
jgi:ABC-type sugar transport system ATPase subunit